MKHKGKGWCQCKDCCCSTDFCGHCGLKNQVYDSPKSKEYRDGYNQGVKDMAMNTRKYLPIGVGGGSIGGGAGGASLEREK